MQPGTYSSRVRGAPTTNSAAALREGVAAERKYGGAVGERSLPAAILRRAATLGVRQTMDSYAAASLLDRLIRLPLRIEDPGIVSKISGAVSGPYYGSMLLLRWSYVRHQHAFAVVFGGTAFHEDSYTADPLGNTEQPA